MRRQFEKQLETLHNNLICMGALCEDAIASASKALLDEDDALREKAIFLEQDINLIERDLEQMCVRLLLHQQPMASDLRRITAAQGMIVDMERIGDQAADIAELSKFMKGSSVKSDVHIAEMARATIKMVTESIDSFVKENPKQAKAVIDYDDVVDDLFSKVKEELIATLINDSSPTSGSIAGGSIADGSPTSGSIADGSLASDGLASDTLDLLMIAKYFERIGDHAVNIAEWVLYSITGNRDKGVVGEVQ